MNVGNEAVLVELEALRRCVVDWQEALHAEIPGDSEHVPPESLRPRDLAVIVNRRVALSNGTENAQSC